MANTLPRGIRNNNPGNLRHGDPWQGLASNQPDPAFCTFQSPVYGIRALARTLITYQDKYGLRTIAQIISRWAPPVENNTQSYVQAVARQTGLAANQSLDMHCYKDLLAVAQAIIRHENGRGPLATPSTWYDASTLDKGLELAGVERPTRTAGKIPLTRETIGATATGGVGLAELADALPQVTEAITQADGHLTSGSIVRVAIGLTLVGVAIFIAWSQVKRHQQGVL
ncbi:hypothetical protein [Orrella sp. 11846]|uniref:hypothetical protein n=1 Tax=Orrella sp. 11846 TaxID=3409913 RepID=UPI003B593732